MNKKTPTSRRDIARNRRATYDYFIHDRIEAGIVLSGAEVKSLRNGRCSISESYVGEIKGEMFLLGSHIEEYNFSSQFNRQDPKRPRKLLLHAKQIKKLIGHMRRKGFTIVPTYMYFNHKHLVKVEIAVGEGKKVHDKRESIKQAEWNRRKARILKGE